MTEKEVKGFLIRMPADQHHTLRVMAANTGCSMNELAVRAIQLFLSGVGQDEEFEIASARVGDRYRSVLDKLGTI
jgi:hypothetical protein